jgi:hypothetical protein
MKQWSLISRVAPSAAGCLSICSGKFDRSQKLARNLKKENCMSKTWEHYHHASRHHERAAYHYKEAAKYDKAEDHEKAETACRAMRPLSGGRFRERRQEKVITCPRYCACSGSSFVYGAVFAECRRGVAS